MPVKRNGLTMLRRLWDSEQRWGYVSLVGIAVLAILGGLSGDSDYWSAAGGALGMLVYWILVDGAADCA
ncbi:MAG: hypothetical protein JXR84_08505 [Anaerolineae bacterium]|nr:hypothetical protein [Anaerolineae bacterium]